MENPTAQNKRHNFWVEQLSAWAESGLSGAKFCKANNLNYHQFVYWRQKLHKGESKTTDQKKCSGFTEVRCGPEFSEGLSLSLPNGVTFRGIGAGNMAVVQALLEVL